MEIRLNRIRPWPLEGTYAHSEVWNQELRLASGAQVSVRAPSGKGKTTLLSFLYGLRRDYEGEVWLDGLDIRRCNHEELSRLRQRRVAYVFQDLQLFPDLTALQNAEIKNRLTGHKTLREIEGLFETLGIADRISQLTSLLSVGQRQRVAIIRALCQPFEYLLLDEPFSHLDEENTRKAKALISAECQKLGAGLVMTALEAAPDLPGQMVLNL